MANKKPSGPSSAVEAPAPRNAPEMLLAITPEERYRRIEKAAYLRAAARHFIGGDPLQDWLEAELEIDRAIER